MFIETLFKSKRPVYCAASLFSPLSRLGGAHLADTVERILRTSPSYPGDAISNYLFLPYRDTNQHEITGPNRARLIYEADIAQLNRSSALLARLDGLAKDSGVGMEVGYAFGLGLPTAILVTDFIGEGYLNTEVKWNVDPVINSMADHVHYKPLHAPSDATYYQMTLNHELDAVREFVQGAFAAFDGRGNQKRPEPPTPVDKIVYIDCMGGRYQWSRQMHALIEEEIRQGGFTGQAAQRYTTRTMPDLLKQVQRDIEHAMEADIAIFCGDAPELDPGSAALFGMCAAMGKWTIYQYTSRQAYKGEGGQEMRVNLMLDQAASQVTTSIEETIEALRTKLTVPE
ncbi:MAG: nucleoside 2-deoxyribosyltransferase [Flavobacteriales bacterium]|nr:nucleoside 2-deoxyribosyltransferase [Flavobacteriales bacterium]